MKNARNVVVTALVVIAAVLGFGVWKGLIPPKAGTEGAIGAAQRYTSPQISDADVQLSDPAIQSFLQSDVFHAIATNPDFQKLVANDAFKKTVQVEGMLGLVSQDFGHGGSQDFNKLVTSDALKNLTAAADFQKVIKDEKAQHWLVNSDFQKLITSPEYQKYAADQLKDAKSTTASKDAMKSLDELKNKPEWKALTTHEDFKSVVTNHDLLAAVANTDLAKIVRDNTKLFASPDFNKVLASENFQKLVTTPEFQKLVTSPEFQNMTTSVEFKQVAANHDFERIVRGGDLSAALAASEDMNKNKVK